MITDIQSYSKFRQGEVAMYSLMGTLKKLDKKLEDKYVKAERDAQADLVKIAKKNLRTSQAARDLARTSEDPFDKAMHQHKAIKESNNFWVKAPVVHALHEKELKKRKEYQDKRDKTIKVALVGASVAALAGLGYGAYKLIKHFKGKDDPKKIMDEIKELEKKAKDQGGLNKTDAERLAVLSKKLSKMAVKEDPANLEKVQKEVETATSKIG